MWLWLLVTALDCLWIHSLDLLPRSISFFCYNKNNCVRQYRNGFTCFVHCTSCLMWDLKVGWDTVVSKKSGILSFRQRWANTLYVFFNCSHVKFKNINPLPTRAKYTQQPVAISQRLEFIYSSYLERSGCWLFYVWGHIYIHPWLLRDLTQDIYI